MAEPILAVFLLLFVAQYPAALYIYIDARRRNLKNPGMYPMGIIVPLGGFAVIPAYFWKRDELPAALEGENERDALATVKRTVYFIALLVVWYSLAYVVRVSAGTR